jgi:hypothetical protein
MSAIVWDEVGSRTYENGLDRGVLYLPDGSAVPWNGLVDVDESPDNNSTSVYYDGAKINELVTLGEFKGQIKAITYPDAMTLLSGMGQITEGLYLGKQKLGVFSLSYRTLVGNDVDSQAGYKIHVLYNVTAVPGGRTSSTLSDNSEAREFDWDISAIPEEIPGFRPTAHIVIDSRYINPAQLAEYEDMLYGTELTDPALIPISDFVNGMYYGYKWKIIDNGDGTWTAITTDDTLLDFDLVDPDKFTLQDIDATYLTDDVYTIKDTLVSP